VIDQLRGVRFADAVVAVAVGGMVVGVAVTADALVEAARATTGTESMDWTDRLLLGLWSFRLEHTLWFTAGLVLLWYTVVRERDLRAEVVDVARLAGGLATGYMLLAAAVVLGATVVAGLGSVGSGAAEVTFDGRERVLTWLLQLSTAAAAGGIWALAAVTLGEADVVAVRAEDEDAPFDDGEPPPQAPPSEPREPHLSELAEVPLPPPPPVPLRPEPVPERPAEVPRASPPTAYNRARRTFEERLAFSPRRDDAKQLLEQIARAEREGRTDEASRLAERLTEM
jgi:hypothetical protein